MATKKRGSRTETGMVEVDQRATAILQKLWAELEDVAIDKLPVGTISQDALEVFQHHEIGWKYSILIQVAGKAASFDLDALCLQKKEGQAGQWDPREFAKRVIVPWNKSIGSPLGDSGDPYVNNIFRRPRFDEAMREGRRSKGTYDTVKGILDAVQASATADQVNDYLKLILAQLRKYLDGKSFDYPVPQRISLYDTLECVAQYLAVSSGGARLQAIAHGFIMALKAKGVAYEKVVSRHVNAADTASQSAGDVECFSGGENIFTVEVKDRELTASEVNGSIEKARLANVRELLFFVHRKNGKLVVGNDATAINEMIANQFALGLNIYIEQAMDILRLGCTLLGEDGRKDFLIFVGVALGEQGADPKHRWAWSQAVLSIGAISAQKSIATN